MTRFPTHRIGTISCALGDDVFVLRRLYGVEALGQPFDLRLELASEQAALDLPSLVGSSLTVRIETREDGPRWLNGVVARIEQRGSGARWTDYGVRVVPWLWLLSQSSNCRIFQRQSVPEIVKQVCAERGITDLADRLQGDYEPLEYCVQYRESDLDFLSRLLESSGIGFYFAHEPKRHPCVLFDSSEGTPACARASATCLDASALERSGAVWSWSLGRELRPGAFALGDYDFSQPNVDLGVSVATHELARSGAGLERYDYPGGYATIAAGDRWVRQRLERSEADSIVSRAESDCAHFAPGSHFELRGHARDDFNQRYLLTRVEHRLEQPLGGEGVAHYSNTFDCLPHVVPYRPPAVTPRPRMAGVQTAVVVGPPGQEIHVDRLGRVKVQFHWDRRGRRDEHSSCWIRVAQAWAGRGFGGMAVPRVGQEVIVDFIEGDPDRPIITGRVYNADQAPPYPLPVGANVTGIRSSSTPGGGGYNEVALDDTRDQERVQVRAQRDLAIHVENDTVSHTGRDRSDQVDRVYRISGDARVEILSGDSVIAVDPGQIRIQAGTGTLVLDSEGVKVDGRPLKP